MAFAIQETFYTLKHLTDGTSFPEGRNVCYRQCPLITRAETTPGGDMVFHIADGSEVPVPRLRFTQYRNYFFIDHKIAPCIGISLTVERIEKVESSILAMQQANQQQMDAHVVLLAQISELEQQIATMGEQILQVQASIQKEREELEAVLWAKSELEQAIREVQKNTVQVEASCQEKAGTLVEKKERQHALETRITELQATKDLQNQQLIENRTKREQERSNLIRQHTSEQLAAMGNQQEILQLLRQLKIRLGSSVASSACVSDGEELG